MIVLGPQGTKSSFHSNRNWRYLSTPHSRDRISCHYHVTGTPPYFPYSSLAIHQWRTGNPGRPDGFAICESIFLRKCQSSICRCHSFFLSLHFFPICSMPPTIDQSRLFCTFSLRGELWPHFWINAPSVYSSSGFPPSCWCKFASLYCRDCVFGFSIDILRLNCHTALSASIKPSIIWEYSGLFPVTRLRYSFFLPAWVYIYTQTLFFPFVHLLLEYPIVILWRSHFVYWSADVVCRLWNPLVEHCSLF